MTTEAVTEMETADNVEETETVSETETTETTEDSETEKPDDEEGSNVTPREKELRRLLRKNEKELERFRKAEEEARTQSLSESEKLQEENSKLQESYSSLLRRTIAAEYGLDADLAERLRGVTEEELQEDAARLAELVKPAKPKPTDVGLGTPGDQDETPVDPRELHRKWMGK